MKLHNLSSNLKNLHYYTIIKISQMKQYLENINGGVKTKICLSVFSEMSFVSIVFWLIFTILILFWFPTNCQSDEDVFYGKDISNLSTLFESERLPQDDHGRFLHRYMATVGNGHIATTVYTDRVFMNGIFNGLKGESHRAVIPSKNNIRINLDGLKDKVSEPSFALDTERGMFIEKFKIGNFQVEERLFAHRYYHKIIVNQFHIKPVNAGVKAKQSIELKMTKFSVNESPDIEFEPETSFDSDVSSKSVCGKTLQVEDPRYQEGPLTVCIIYSELPDKIIVNSEMTITHFASYDKSLRGAGGDFSAVAALISSGNHADIYDTHVKAWNYLWNEGKIEIEGNLELSKVIHGCLYYILSSLPVTGNTYSAVGQFYGISPGGLSSGSALQDLQGHTFWDAEIWLFPVIAYFYPETSRELLNYRLFQVKAARDRATESGYLGIRFPWEGGITGNDVTPECCPQNKDLQVHITADIAFAIRQYIAITRDIDWLREKQPNHITNACGLIRGIAEFWTSRATFNKTTGFHDINDVVPPDDDHSHVNNNGFTNVMAGYAIFFAKYAKCLCEESMEAIPERWINIAKSLRFIYDSENDYHPEYEGYTIGEVIKQADSVLLGFPLMYPMDPKTRKNDLNIYEKVTRQNGPAMTWAIHTIGILELDELQRAEVIFNRSYQSYMREPYKIWTDNQPPTVGSVNFLTGMGGFLQTVVSGYGGYRLHLDKIVFSKPRVPPGCLSMKFVGLNFLENVFDILIQPNSIKITLKVRSSKYFLIVENKNESFSFVSGRTEVSLVNTEPPTSFTLKTIQTGLNCSLPLDLINLPFVEKDEGNSLAVDRRLLFFLFVFIWYLF